MRMYKKWGGGEAKDFSIGSAGQSLGEDLHGRIWGKHLELYGPEAAPPLLPARRMQPNGSSLI